MPRLPAVLTGGQLKQEVEEYEKADIYRQNEQKKPKSLSCTAAWFLERAFSGNENHAK